MIFLKEIVTMPFGMGCWNYYNTNDEVTIATAS
jgi:hypothetical protein